MVKICCYGSNLDILNFCNKNLICESYEIVCSYGVDDLIKNVPSCDLFIVLETWTEQLDNLIRKVVKYDKCVFVNSDMLFMNLSRCSLASMLMILKDESPLLTYLQYIISTNINQYPEICVDNMVFLGKPDYIPVSMARRGMVFSKQEIDTFLMLLDIYYPNSTGEYFVDCGCNIGTTTIYICKHTSLKGLAFEPVRESFKLAKVNAILNGVEKRIIFDKRALSNKRGEGYVRIDGMDLGSSCISNDSNIATNERITFSRLDGWLKKKKIQSNDIKFVWLDAEGHEGYILLGFEEILKERKIPICMEFSPYMLKKQGDYKEALRIIQKYFSRYIVIDEWIFNKDRGCNIHSTNDISLYNDSETVNLFLIA